jgi:hypothetical protein
VLGSQAREPADRDDDDYSDDGTGGTGCRKTHPKNWFAHPSHTSCKRHPVTAEEIVKARPRKLKVRRLPVEDT